MSHPAFKESVTSTAQCFTAGNYTEAALQGRPEDWQSCAALGLVGKATVAIEGLSRFDHPEAKFYSAVASWIDGDEQRAVRVLNELSEPHARNLLALIRKKKISVLAQLDCGSPGDFITAIQNDPKFAIRNVGFKQGDMQNKPYADVHEFYDRKNPPDFYVAKLIEWHLLPPKLQELPCPILGHTADYDIHIQTVHPWLQIFDELVVTDHTEWADVSRLVKVPVSTFPKSFGLAKALPCVPTAARPVDVFISGTAMHPYHPDKARLLHQVLAMPEPVVRFVNGFVGPDEYLKLLGQTKIAYSYVRHRGAMPTRGLESLAMGAAIVVQESSVLQIFLDEKDGVLNYDVEKENLPEIIRRILGQWSEFEQRARRGADVVRKEFDSARVASQYFRFLTFLAAKPRGQRRLHSPEIFDQKRNILSKGWSQSPAVNREFLELGLARWAGRLGSLLPSDDKASANPSLGNSASARPVIDMTRELMLEYATAAYPPVARIHSAHSHVTLPVERDLLVQALQLYRLGAQRFPRSLVLRFNWVRTALHFGERAEVSEALQVAEETVRLPTSEWQIHVMDDVFPWDFLSQFFNYRAYLDACTLHLQTGEPVQKKLTALILASIQYYLSFYASEPAQAMNAVKLDPEFPFYKLHCARQLIRSQNRDSYPIAGTFLAELAGNSMLFLQAFEELHPLRDRGLYLHPRFAELAGKVELAKKRIVVAGCSVEDWNAIPLQVPMAEETGLPSPRSASPPEVCRPSKILFLPLEIADWKQARHLAYPAQLGLEEGLTAQGVDFVTLPMIRGLSPEAHSAWLRQVQQRCQTEKFDQVWVEIVHSEWKEESLSWLAELAPKRVGFLMESLSYGEDSYALDPRLRIRQSLVESRLKYLTHLVAVDEEDVSRLNERALISAMWWPQTVPERFIGSIPSRTPEQRAIFYGQLYGERQAWLDSDDLRRLLLRPDQAPEDAAGFPVMFDSVNRAFATALESGVALDARAFADHVDTLRKIRGEIFRLWLAALQNGCAVVNLPSLFSGYAGRVYEAMAAGRPVISWEVPKRPRTRDLFRADEEILLFPTTDLEPLARQIRCLQGDPDQARSLAEKARTKLLAAHTVERRVSQILNWIATGQEPDFHASAHRLATHFARGESKGSSTIIHSETNVAPPGEALTELLLATGTAHLHLGQNGPAHERFSQAVAAKPKNPDSQILLATSAARLGLWQQCNEALGSVLAYEADHPEAWKLLGDLSLKHGFFDQAIKIQRLLMLRLANNPASCVGLASAYLQSGLASSAGKTDPLQKLATDLTLGEYLPFTTRDNEIANEPFAVPECTPARSFRDFVARHLPAAWSRAERRMCLRPFETPAVARLGGVCGARELLQTKEWTAAWNATSEALRVRPYHPEAWLLLAEIAEACGDTRRARELAEHSRQLAPAWKPAKKFLKSLHANGTTKIQLPVLPESLRIADYGSRLSIFVITKNEECFLGQCLKSIQGIADQIVVVDTGSTDKTRDIAASFGAEVYSFEWCDHFSAARNAALERVTGDWVLMLDADEELLPDQHEKLLKLLEDKSAIAFRLPMIDQGREEEGVSYVPRLFRNAPGLFFVGRVHEQIFSSVEVRRAEWGLENSFGNATLLHHGYTKEMVRTRNKIARNLRLLEMAVKEMPGEPNLLMNLGLELVRDDRLDQGLERYEEAFRALTSLPKDQVVPELRESLLTQYCTHLLTAKNYARIARVLQSLLAKSGGLTATMHWLFGLACIESKGFVEGAEQMRQCLTKRDKPALSPVNKNILKAGPSHCLALCLSALKQAEAADKAFRAAVDADPKSSVVQFDYARFLAENGHEVEALKWVHQLSATDPSDAMIWLFGGHVALSKPDFLEFACDWTSEAIKFFPAHGGIAQQRAQALLLSGRTDGALPLWKQFGAASIPSHCAALIICETLHNQPLQPVPAEMAGRVEQEFVTWYRRLLAANAGKVIHALNERKETLRRVVPAAVQLLEAARAEANAVPVQ